jgi:hypothetical protein
MNMDDILLIFSRQTVWGILARFVVNLIFLTILIGFIYFRYSKKEKFLFTFFLSGIIVFFLITAMNFISLTLTFAVGLFAIFGVLRFRTTNFGVKDMAYIFTAIGISVINSLVLRTLPYLGILAFNCIIILSTFILEEIARKHTYKSHRITYKQVEFLRPENQAKLLEDVSSLSGRKITRIKILKIDYNKESADLDIFFRV